jgi:fibro-slime domain-containing protein
MRSPLRARLLSTLLGAAPLAGGACGPAPRPGDTPGTADAGNGGAGFIDAAPLGDAGASEDCSALAATVRDFRRTHPDFESFTRDEVYPGIVMHQLGADGTPVYAGQGPTPHTSGPAAFADWYHDVPGTNLAIPITIHLTKTPSETYVYDNDAFFPIDGQGFGNEGFQHNYHFTTEIHTAFTYEGGERFTFRGDDDLWLFVNGRLAIDLGGLHQPASQTLDLDQRAGELGITPGHMYTMDIFHAERHTVASTFHIETTIDCFVIP